MLKGRRKKRKSNIPPETPLPAPAKIKSWTPTTVLSLILGALGAVGIVAVWPQIGVSTQESLAKSKPFYTPFRIDNVGPFPIPVAHVYCYVRRIEANHQFSGSNVMQFTDWDGVTLRRGDGGVVICALSTASPPNLLADVVIVVDYKPLPKLPCNFRKYFRFRGAYVDNWQWIRQPYNKIESETDKAIVDIVSGYKPGASSELCSDWFNRDAKSK